MQPKAEAPCSHPGCDRAATEIAVAESAWEDTATGSALMVCAEHVETYVRGTGHVAADGTANLMLRAHRRGVSG